jgi:hypothetical protein
MIMKMTLAVVCMGLVLFDGKSDFLAQLSRAILCSFQKKLAG